MDTLSEIVYFGGPEHQPFQFGPPNAPSALMLHGFFGTPAEMLGLGVGLAEAGWQAHSPLLPGFGSQVPQLKHTRGSDWLTAAQEAWAAHAHPHKPNILVGYSMGSALAVQVAVSSPTPPSALVLIAPFWRLPGLVNWAIPLVYPILREVRPFELADFNDPKLRAKFGHMLPGVDLDDPTVQKRLRREATLPVRVMAEVVWLGQAAFKQAKSLDLPVLIIQGQHDPVVRNDLTAQLLRRLPSTTQYVEIEGGHDLVQPDSAQQPEVLAAILNFLQGLNLSPQREN